MTNSSSHATTIDEVARALVRPIVTVMFAAGFVFFTFTGVISGDVFAGAALTVIAYWFASRTSEKRDAVESAVVESITKAGVKVDGPPPPSVTP
jgi:hypothetical protein